MIDTTNETLNYDSDDDLDVERDREGTIQIGAELIVVSRTCYYIVYIRIYTQIAYLQNIAYPRSSIWSVCKCGEALSY